MSTVSSNLDFAAFFTIATASWTVYFFALVEERLRRFPSFSYVWHSFSCFGFWPSTVIPVAPFEGAAVGAVVLVCSIDDIDSHRAGGAGDALHRGVDRVRVHVLDLQRGELTELLVGDLADLVLVRLFGAAARLLRPWRARRPS